MPFVRRRGGGSSGPTIVESATAPTGVEGLVWRNAGVYKAYLDFAWRDIDFYDGLWAAGTGGNTVVDIDGYRYHKFTAVGNASFICSQAGKIEYLIIAGGGGGGGCYAAYGGGGGGAGGLLIGSFNVESSQELNIQVGDGGDGGKYSPTYTNVTQGSNGSNSAINSLIAYGGGGGGAGCYNNVGVTIIGSNGGSGGGAGKSDVALVSGGEGTLGQGYDGQDFISGGLPGKGGGAGEDGAAGGAGLEVWGVTYAAGGGLTVVAGTVNTGNGGGGGSNATKGAAGGSGIVIIRYAI